MSSNQPYPPSNNPAYPPQQQLNQFPPPTYNYGSAYPPPSNQSPYPPPVETVPSTNPAFPPPPSYDTAVGAGKPAASAPSPYYSYQTQPMPPAGVTAPPSYPPTSSDVEYQGSAFHDRIISFDDKTIRLGMFLLKLNRIRCL